MKPWLSAVGLPKFAEVKTLVRVRRFRSWFAPSLVSRPASGDCAGFIKPATHADVETAKCTEPLTQPWCYLDWGDVFPLLRGRYPTVLAPTGSCVHPLASPVLRFIASFQESVQVATQPLLPMGCSRCYLRKSFPRCLAPKPDGPIGCIYLFLPRCQRPSLDPS